MENISATMSEGTKDKGWVPVTPAANPVTKHNDTSVEITKYQETTDVDVSLGLDSTKAPNLPKNQKQKNKRNSVIELNEKPQKKPKEKKHSHRPRVYDASQPKKNPKPKAENPKTPKQQTPQLAIPRAAPLYARKSNLKTSANANLPSKKKLNFNMEKCMLNLSDIEDSNIIKHEHDNKGSKVDIEVNGCSLQNSDAQADGQMNDVVQLPINSSDIDEPACDLGNSLEETFLKMIPEMHNSLKTYQRIFQTNACQKNSRKTGPNFPRMCKKPRTPRQRAAEFDKLHIVTVAKEYWQKVNPLLGKEKTANNSACREIQETVKRLAPLQLVKKMKHVFVTAIVTKKRSQRERPALDLTLVVKELNSTPVVKGKRSNRSQRLTQPEGCKPEAFMQVQDEDTQSLATEDLVKQLELVPDNIITLDNIVVPDNIITPDNVVVPDSALSCHVITQKCKVESEFFFQLIPRAAPPNLQQNYALTRRNDKAYIEDLINNNMKRLECLSLGDRYNQLVVRNQKGHGTVVTYEGKSPPKKIKQVAKVHLDEETLRVWNLLMETGENTEEPKNDTSEYWVKEKEILRIRMESFISRMHLVQGDRRFSRWKGSVIDSIVGVFLTQNVSDHLSSDCFMNLVSLYPPLHLNATSSQKLVGSSKVPSGRSYVNNEKPCVFPTEYHEPNTQVRFEPNNGNNSSSIYTSTMDLAEEGLVVEDKPASTSSSSHTQDEVKSNNGDKTSSHTESTSGREKKKGDKQEDKVDWDELRRTYKMDHNIDTTDSVNWEAIRQSPVKDLAAAIGRRGMNNILAERIKNFLDRVVKDHESLDLEWLRDVPLLKAKDYLLSIPGLGLKSVECVRLLALHHPAFPVDTNIGRILVRLGWVPLQPLPEDVQIHLLNQYPYLDTVQKYIWPRLCDQETLILYEFHYQLITAGKVFCTKRAPNCNACPMRGDCKHFASAFASSKLRLQGTKGKKTTNEDPVTHQDPKIHNFTPQLLSEGDFPQIRHESHSCEPIIEIPPSPEYSPVENLENPLSLVPELRDIEDLGYESEDEIPIIRLNDEGFRENIRELMENTGFLSGEGDVSKALVTLNPNTAAIPMPKLKNVTRLRTVHQVYELPDSHPLLEGFEKREPDDPCPYLFAIWLTDGNCQKSTIIGDSDTSHSGNTDQNENDKIVRGTVLIPCRTFNRGAFPLNGTYFQPNEVFADHETSRRPIAVPREWIWNLRRRAVCCGTSTTSICKAMFIEETQYYLTKGYICIRGVDRKTRAPRLLNKRFHLCVSRKHDDDD